MTDELCNARPLGRRATVTRIQPSASVHSLLQRSAMQHEVLCWTPATVVVMRIAERSGQTLRPMEFGTLPGKPVVTTASLNDYPVAPLLQHIGQRLGARCHHMANL